MILFKRMWHALYVVFGEGSWALTPYESIVVDAALACLDANTRKQVERQLAQPYFVERTNKRINVIRFYAPDLELKISSSDYQDALICVKTRVDDRVIRSNVTFYKGLIFSVETKKPGKFFIHKKIEVLYSKKSSSADTLTKAIDRCEHGR